MRTPLVFAAAVACILSPVANHAAETVSSSPASAETALRSGTVNAPDARQIPATGTPIVLDAGKGTLLHLDRPASTVFIANPEIADVQVKSPSLIYVDAKKPGETVLYAVDAEDHVLLNSPIRVQQDLTRLRQSFQSLLPGENIDVKAVDNSLLLSGIVSTAGRAEKARALAGAIAASTNPQSPIINEMSVATPNQVTVQVRIAEMDRNVVKQLGINLTKTNGTANPSFSTINAAAPTTAGGTVTFKFGPSGAQIMATLDALETEGLVKFLAEPNLTTVSGQPASFIVGGSIPCPSAAFNQQGQVSPSVQTVSPEVFGVSLQVTPTIVDANHVNLKIRPQVSEPTSSGTLSCATTSFTLRQAETTVELGSGESFALAGLYQDRTESDINKFPWLADIPVLGQLFRSQSFQRQETDLVIIVTPYLVKPSAVALSTPADGFVEPHDVEQIINGATYRQSLPAPGKGPISGSQGLVGPVGFRID